MKITPPALGETNLNLVFLNSKPFEKVNLQTRTETLVKETNLNRFIDFGTIPTGNYSLNSYLANNERVYKNDLKDIKDQEAYTVVLYEKDDELAYLLDDDNKMGVNYEEPELKIYLNQEKYLSKNGKPIESIYIKDKNGNIIKSLRADGSIYFTPTLNLTEIDAHDIYFDDKFVYTFKGTAARSYKLVILAKENDEVSVLSI